MAHTGERMCYTVEVFIVHDGKVLLRMHDKYGLWLSVGGHIEANEDPNEAALREVHEEVGLDIELVPIGHRFETVEDTFRNLVPPVGLNRHRADDTHEHVTFVFFARSKEETIGGEGGECRWVSEGELSNMDLRPNVREYALQALRELGA